MTVAEALRILDRHGSDCDPIVLGWAGAGREGELEPRDLPYEADGPRVLDDASTVRIQFWGQPRGQAKARWRRGTLKTMAEERARTVDPLDLPSVKSTVPGHRCPTCGRAK